MIGNERTYFTLENCIRPFVIMNGMVYDAMCTELLTLSEIRQELHKHLRANGFDAVFFYDPRKVLTMYDAQSSFVYSNHRRPTPEECRRFTTDPRAHERRPAAAPPELPQDDEILILDDFVSHAATEASSMPDQIFTPLRTDHTADINVVRQHIHAAMTSEDLRCALVFYHLEQWKSAMAQEDIDLLHELDRIRESRRSIAIFLAPSEPGQDIGRLLTQGGTSGHWANFAGQYLLPGLEKREGTPDSDLRLITLGAPGKGELRSYLSMMRLRHIPRLRIKLEQMDDICRELAAICSEKYISLRTLNQRMEEWIRDHPDSTFTIENLSEIIGGGRYRTARAELDEMVGMDKLKAFFEKKANQQLLEKKTEDSGDETTRLTPRQPIAEPSEFGLNILLMGNPGTGKTKSIGLIGKLFRELKLLPRGHIRSLSVRDMMQHDFRMDEEFRMALGGVLAIDEAYSLMDELGGERVLNALTDCMSRYAGQLSVVLAGYKDRLLELLDVNPGLNSRFPEGGRIELPPYGPDELRRIFLKMAENRQGSPLRISESLERVLPDLFANWVNNNKHRRDWGNARAAANLLDTMVGLCSTRYARARMSAADGLILTEDDLPENMKKLTAPRAENLEQALRILEQDIVGMDNVKKFLMGIVNDVKLHEGQGQPPGAYLFMGPPGTGKSMMSEQIGTLLYLLNVIKSPHTVVRTAKDLLNPPPKRERPGQPGNPNRNGLRDAVEEAKGGVLFIDEAHQLAGNDTTNGVQTGRGILKDLVPIMEDPEFRATTCLILAGYTGPMERLLMVDQGFASRFPPKNRIRFTNYSADELTEIMKGFAGKRGEILEKGFIDRTRTALSRYLPNVGSDFGNARWIRNEYLPNARAKRDRRLLAPFALNQYETPTEEQLASIPDEARITLTAADIPDTGGLSALAGPINAAPPPVLTPEGMLDELYEKEQLVAFARSKINPEVGQGFMDTAESSGINFALCGPTGSGRRTAIRAIAEVFAKAGLIDSKEVRYYSRGNLVAGYVGQTPEQTRAAISDSQGGVAVIMNPSDLFKTGPGSGQDFGPEAVQELANCIADYSANTCFVLVDSKEGLERFFKSAASYRRYFRNSFELKDLSIEAMQKIFDRKIKHNFAFEESIQGLMEHDFVANWVTDRGGLGAAFQNWNNGAEIDTLLDKLREAWTNTPEDSRRELVDDEGYPVRCITRDMFEKNKRGYLKETSLQEQSALNQLNDMVGWTRVKSAINLIRTKLATAKEPEDIVPGNYLFIGNPGTGKTEAAKLMGSLLRATHALKQGYVITRTAGEMMDQLGEFDKILEMARNNVLFIDEAHQLGSPRGAEVMKRLLTVLEDPEVKKDTCIILAGYPREMDELLALDPGLRSRFDLEESRVYFDDYTAEELERIMESMAAKADRIREIGARAPLDMSRSPDFVRRARRIFETITAQGDPNFGNARYVRNFLHNSVNRQILRLAAKYGEEAGAIPAEEYALLSAEDIPEREGSMIRESEKKRHYDISASQLHVTEEGTAPITPETARSAKEVLGRSVMLLEVIKNNRVAGYGTGFVITKEGLLLTCAHVVRGADSVRAHMYWPGLPGGPEFSFNCEILHPIREQIDMAVLQITDGSDFVPLNLRDAEHPVEEAEHTMMIGFPFGIDFNPDIKKLRPNLFPGSVSSIQNAGEDKEICGLAGEGKAGNSGSPVFSQTDGRVVGVFDGSKIQRGKSLTEEINYFTSIRLFWKYFVNGDSAGGDPAVPAAPDETA